MIIRTVKQHGEFAILPNAAINDEDLSWEARGVLAYLLSKPDGWQVYQSDLVKRGPAQEHKVARIMTELETAGYVRRRRVNGNGGRWNWITEIFETPQETQNAIFADHPAEQSAVDPLQVVEPYGNNCHMVDAGEEMTASPYGNYPSMENPRQENPRQEKCHIQQYLQQLESTQASTDSEPKQQQQQASVRAEPGSDPAAAAVRAELEAFGVTGSALDVLSDRPLAHVQGWIAYASTQTNLRSPVGYVIRQLSAGRPPPPLPKEPEEEDPESYQALMRRYVPAEYADIIDH